MVIRVVICVVIHVVIGELFSLVIRAEICAVIPVVIIVVFRVVSYVVIV